MILNVILAILVLSVIIIVHEFGHFIVAKANGVTVIEFALGFGPKLVHFKKGETDYCIKLLPFGGSCLMFGDEFLDAVSSDIEEDDDDTDEDIENKIEQKKKELKEKYNEEKSFSNKPVWSRLAIIAAGPVFNFLFAFILSIVMIGIQGYDPCTVTKVYENSPAYQAGLQDGDEILKINSENMTFAKEYSFYRYYNASKQMNITYLRNGEKYQTTVNPEYKKEQSYKIGIIITKECSVGTVSENSPASKAGLMSGDIIKKINGNEVIGSDFFIDEVKKSGGNEINLLVYRDGNDVEIKINPELVETESYYTGIYVAGNLVKGSPIDTIVNAFKEVGYWIKLVIKSLGMMFTGQVGINDLSGPVGTVSVMSSVVGESRSTGAGIMPVVLSLCYLAIMISANLGVMNLLPLPALDGGRLVFFIIEIVRGKPVKKEHEGMVHFVGMVLLMILMVYVMFKDIVALF